MKIFLAIFVGMIIGFLIGYTICALFCINNISTKKEDQSEKGDVNE